MSHKTAAAGLARALISRDSRPFSPASSVATNTHSEHSSVFNTHLLSPVLLLCACPVPSCSVQIYLDCLVISLAAFWQETLPRGIWEGHLIAYLGGVPCSAESRRWPLDAFPSANLPSAVRISPFLSSPRLPDHTPLLHSQSEPNPGPPSSPVQALTRPWTAAAAPEMSLPSHSPALPTSTAI